MIFFLQGLTSRGLRGGDVLRGETFVLYGLGGWGGGGCELISSSLAGGVAAMRRRVLAWIDCV